MGERKLEYRSFAEIPHHVPAVRIEVDINYVSLSPRGRREAIGLYPTYPDTLKMCILSCG